MLIEGPFTISILDNGDAQSKELHLIFTADFKNSNVPERVGKLQAYIMNIANNTQDLALDSPDRQGMLIVKQLSEQLLSHISNDEMELDETIVIEINKEFSINNLIESSALN